MTQISYEAHLRENLRWWDGASIISSLLLIGAEPVYFAVVATLLTRLRKTTKLYLRAVLLLTSSKACDRLPRSLSASQEDLMYVCLSIYDWKKRRVVNFRLIHSLSISIPPTFRQLLQENKTFRQSL